MRYGAHVRENHKPTIDEIKQKELQVKLLKESDKGLSLEEQR